MRAQGIAILSPRTHDTEGDDHIGRPCANAGAATTSSSDGRQASPALLRRVQRRHQTATEPMGNGTSTKALERLAVSGPTGAPDTEVGGATGFPRVLRSIGAVPADPGYHVGPATQQPNSCFHVRIERRLMVLRSIWSGDHRAPVAQRIERRPPEPDRLSVVATLVGPRAKCAGFYALCWLHRATRVTPRSSSGSSVVCAPCVARACIGALEPQASQPDRR